MGDLQISVLESRLDSYRIGTVLIEDSGAHPFHWKEKPFVMLSPNSLCVFFNQFRKIDASKSTIRIQSWASSAAYSGPIGHRLQFTLSPPLLS